MIGKTLSIRLNSQEQLKLQNIKDNGYSLMDAVRAGLDTLTDPAGNPKSKDIANAKDKIKPIKTKKEAEKAVETLNANATANADSFITHGCGCLKSKDYLCEKHGRA